MAIQGLSAEEKFGAASRDVLDRLGIHLTQGTDFEEYLDILADARPDHVIGGPFDPRLHDLSAQNAVWIVGKDDTGKVMHTQALRCLSLGSLSLGGFMRRKFRDFSPPGMDIDFERSRYRAGPGAKNMMGRVVYSGETWIGGTPGQFRATGLSGILGRHAFLTAIQTFAPDYVIGFMTKPVATKGFVQRMGFMHSEPFALQWYQRGHIDPMEGYLVYMSDEDMRYVLDMPVSDIEALAA